ncbi:MAG: HD domain-containing phosphohydrolase [Candidatus Margulisiibacteriota bacterium]
MIGKTTARRYSPINWLSNYCFRRGLTAIDRETPGTIRYPRRRLIQDVAAELCQRLTQPTPLAVALKKAEDESALKVAFSRRLAGFIFLANQLSRDENFVADCLLEASRYYDLALYQHQVRVTLLSGHLADRLGLDGEPIMTAAMTHDFGKIGMPWDIMNKGHWTEDEKELKPFHLQLSLLAVSAIRSFAEVAKIVHYNHYYDGYPNGVAGKPVPLAGQVLSAADFYDALTTPRPSRNGRAKPASEALQKFEERGRSTEVATPYDPRLIAALRETVLSRPDLF